MDANIQRKSEGTKEYHQAGFRQLFCMNFTQNRNFYCAVLFMLMLK